MAHADRENQKGHKDRVWVQRVAERGQHAELPHHGDQRSRHHQGSGTHATCVPEHHCRGDGYRKGEKQQDRAHALDQVSDNLGESGDMDADALTLVLRAQRLKPLRKLRVIKWAALRVLDQKRYVNDAGLAVERDNLADLTGARDVRA